MKDHLQKSPITMEEDASTRSSQTIHVSPFLPDESISYIQVYHEDTWPKSSSRMCFHCAECIPDVPIPAVENFQINSYQLYPYHFCRPGCSLAFLRDCTRYLDSRKEMYTRQLLRTMGFESCTAFPSRCMLTKFGGPWTPEKYYGNSLEYITIHAPPFVTYAMFAEFRRKDVESSSSSSTLTRPTTRSTDIAERTETGKSVQLLNFIASKETKEDKPDKKRKNLKNFVK